MKSSENPAIINIESERSDLSRKSNWCARPNSARKKDIMMTKIEAYRAVVAGEVTEEVKEKFAEMIAAYEGEAAKRRERAAEKRAEKLEGEKGLETAVYEFLGEEAVTASQIMEAVEGIASAQKATIIVKRLVEAGMAEQVEVKTKGRKVKGYVRV